VGNAGQNSIDRKPSLIVFHYFYWPDTQSGTKLVQPFNRHRRRSEYIDQMSHRRRIRQGPKTGSMN
jgi:hypothetical protein